MPKEHLMQADELIGIAKIFVEAGVDKIRLTGGEPLVRKDFPEILKQLATLPVELTITSNGIGIHKHIDLLQSCGVRTINLSLDTLDNEKFKKITRRDYLEEVLSNAHLLLENGFQVKINAVMMKDVNDDEIVDFIELTKNNAFVVRFIEFMPFDGNRWKRDQALSYNELLEIAQTHYKKALIKIDDAPNDTTRNFKIEGHQGSFGIIGTVTNPFCDTCNRIRLTANGRLKNCLFSGTETDLLTAYREGKEIRPLIFQTVQNKNENAWWFVVFIGF